MKYWDHVITKELTFNQAKDQIHKYKPYYMTRPEWDGVHFYDKFGEYNILFKDGHVEYNMIDKAWDKDKSDWMIVTITDEALQILVKNNLI
ncbi:MAG: hypothetical protein LIR50_05360 [Bacillota bacterium]|nr:hypothetical protein [Bacillota bacterium]